MAFGEGMYASQPSLEPPLLPAEAAVGSSSASLRATPSIPPSPLFLLPLNTPSLFTMTPKDRATTLRPLLGPGKVFRGEGTSALKEAQLGEAWSVDQIRSGS